MSGSQNSRAIVLRGRPYGESDKIVTFLTEDFGKLTGIAKGAKRSRRRFANSLDALARVRVYFRQRPRATLAFLERCELLQSSSALATPSRFAYGSYLIELADQMTAESHPVRELYALLEEALAALEQGPATNAFLRAFELQLLTGAGYEPQLDHCVRCQCNISSAESAFTSTEEGTFWCSSCRQSGGALLEVVPGALARLTALKRLPLAACQEQSLGGVAGDAAAVTGRLLALYLTRPLRSVKLIGQLATDPV